MSSLRKRVTSYFRQLSFHNEPREQKRNINENSFVTKYLMGQIKLRDGPPVLYGKSPNDLPNFELGSYTTGSSTIVGCSTGPSGGLTTVKRIEKHLSVTDPDIDFIDTQDETGASGQITRDEMSTSDPLLPKQWDNKTDYVYGLSDSLYDVNQATKCKNGNPIADCYGIIARNDSAILALADGVNWGEKACIAAKSAVHGCLHYLNKTIFDDTTLFDFTTTNKTETTPQFYDSQNSPIITSNLIQPKKEKPTQKKTGAPTTEHNENRITNTTEVFISLLRAFNCAHNLILENQGMLTTLTVAVVLPLKSSNYKRPRRNTKDNVRIQKHDDAQVNKGHISRELRHNDGNFARHYSNRKQAGHALVKPGATKVHSGGDSGMKCEEKCEKYICCVCNVGDTLAYVYSQKYGIRELTKGSHDVYCNRDMRDALGALGPVDGINPELNNLTLSISTLDAGDIILIASDGLTDNYDPTVCKFTVNSLTSDNSRNHRSSPGLYRNRDRQTPRPLSTPIREMKSREKRASFPPKPTETSSARLSSPIYPTRTQKDLTTASTSTKPEQRTEPNPSPKPDTDNLEYEICDNPLIAHFMLDNAFDNDYPAGKINDNQSSQSQNVTRKPKQVSTVNENSKTTLNPLMKSSSVSAVLKAKSSTAEQPNFRYNFLRSKTTLELRQPSKIIPRNEDGLPYVTPIQKYEITLLLIEDILKRGISGKDKQCTTAKILCENLLRYTISITSAKRHTLEDVDLYFDNKNDILVEVSQKEKKLRRKRCLEKIQNLPGKLDHVSVVAYNVGNKVVEYDNN